MIRISTAIMVAGMALGLFACSTGDDTKLYDINVTVDGDGKVSPAEGTYEEGEIIELEATGNDSYDFIQWSGDIESAENPYQLTVDRDYTISAQFGKREYDLSVNNSKGGTVEQRLVQAKTYEHGAVVELNAIPDAGQVFVEWTGDLSSTDNPKTIVVDEPKDVTAHFQVKSDIAAVKINVDWNSLDFSSGKSRTAGTENSITHFGARLIYPEKHAVFQQSVEKITADSLGVITMEVPSADEARLLVAAVQYDSGLPKVHGFGVMKDISIQKGVGYEWHVEDIKWTAPSWQVISEQAEDYEKGNFTVDKEKQRFKLNYKVNSPYNTAPSTDYEELLIRLNGSGGIGEYSNGYRDYYVSATNPTPGTPNESTYQFYPWLVSEMFNLPNARYVVQEKGSFTVKWE